MKRDLIIGDVHFDTANIRQTALHVMNFDGCDDSMTQEQVEHHLKECALAAINSGENDKNKMIIVKDMKACFVVEDNAKSSLFDNPPHRYEVAYYVRVGHRQER